MAAQVGRLAEIRFGVGGTKIAYVRTVTARVNGEAVDVTTKDDAGARTLLAGAGVYSASFNVAGMVSDNDDLNTLRDYSIARSLNIFEFYYADGDKMSASFQVTNWEAGGGYNDAQGFSCTLESSGAITTTTV